MRRQALSLLVENNPGVTSRISDCSVAGDLILIVSLQGLQQIRATHVSQLLQAVMSRCLSR